MTQETVLRLIEKNLTAIYGYAFNKLYDKSEAEDLSQEIIIEILSSAENLKNDAAFWGFAWKIAENTFRKFIKRHELIKHCVSLESENLVEVLTSPESDEYTECDELKYRLRRELSLLGKRHREICISYYVHNKSCSSIAKEQGISIEMVKQNLFKVRKHLKEGMEMERKLGEKSYNPGILKLGFWGDWNHYGNVCNRKLPGAILLAAYNNPTTAEGLSLELGVAMPYLEEEIETLVAAGLLLKNGKKYETNIVIITNEYEKKFEKETSGIYPEVANEAYKDLAKMLPQIRLLDFKGNDYDDNRLLFAVINIALMNGYDKANELSPIGQPHKLALGGYGWVYGYDNNYENGKFRGIAGHAGNADGTAYFSAENYCALLSVQNFVHKNFAAEIEGMCDAILEKTPDTSNITLPYLIENKFIISKDGKLLANFPVFEEKVFNELCELLIPASKIVSECMINISDKGESILSAMVPSHLKEQCKDIAKIYHRLNTAAYLMEALIKSGVLIPPEDKTPLCVFGVKIK